MKQKNTQLNIFPKPGGTNLTTRCLFNPILLLTTGWGKQDMKQHPSNKYILNTQFPMGRGILKERKREKRNKEKKIFFDDMHIT